MIDHQKYCFKIVVLFDLPHSIYSGFVAMQQSYHLPITAVCQSTGESIAMGRQLVLHKGQFVIIKY